MKILFLTLSLLLTLKYTHGQTSEAPYRIFGKISTVDNKTYKGFISWGENNNYWIDFFEATKKENPYAGYFNREAGVLFYNNGQNLTKPPIHIFSCRFGNIHLIQPISENELKLVLKNGDEIILKKSTSHVKIGDKMKCIPIKWEHISSIQFMPADSNTIPASLNQMAGILSSSHGIYQGLITWNYGQRRDEKTNMLLSGMAKVVRDKNELKVVPKTDHFQKPVAISLRSVKNIFVNIPSIGTVTVPFAQFKELSIIPISELSLLTYNDFKSPKPIEGKVFTKEDETVEGKLAYDLDESYDFESIEAYNNSITYKIPFKYIRSIEPKNYKYSFLTLKNGSELSLGGLTDVNKENSGIMIFGNHNIPTYILWNMVKKIEIKN